jgi:two-component system NtrC family response regulator
VRVLVADDEKSITMTLEEDLREAGHEVRVASTGDEAWRLLERDRYECVISDINMPGMKGDELLRRAKAADPDVAVILVTGYGSIDSAVQAMKDGATDYILKPFRNEQIVHALAKLGKMRSLEVENENLRTQIREIAGFENIVGQSPAMRAVLEMVRTVAKTDTTVLLQGETGTGKEVIARAIHNNSARSKGAWVAISCAAIPATLLEDELFGHERGAFTDAKDRKLGRFERAEGGTFFLDDIDDLALATQVKLVRVLQEREVERLGGDKPVKVNIRVIAATKLDLHAMVKEGRFREDLYYRLNVVPVVIPALRDRRGDVPLLVRHFIRKYAGGRDLDVTPETLAAMDRHRWPGNVRELEHAVERAIALAGAAKHLDAKYLIPDADPARAGAPANDGRAPAELGTLRKIVEDAEREHIKRVLKVTGNHRAQAAAILGISRKNLWEKLKLHDLDAGDEG